MKQTFNEDLKLLLKDVKQIEGNSMGKTKEFNPGLSCPNEILQLLLEDIKRAADPKYDPQGRQIAVQNYKIFCEAEAVRAEVKERQCWMERNS